MRSRAPLAWAARGTVSALLCALALAMFSGALLKSQLAQAAPQATFYGIPDNALLTSTATPSGTATTATATATTATTATDTPAATATSAATATATATPAPTATSTPAPTATPSGPPPNNFDVSAAAAEAAWPQQAGNWCGVATVTLIADYLNPSAYTSQQDIVNIVSSPASTSEWGAPPWVPNYGPGVTADISADFGTDPRSLAYGLTVATGMQYHAVVDTNGAWDTTIHIVDTVLLSRQPVSVFVDHGQHSVIVSGVDATGDPLTNPGSITAIHVWDPGTTATNSSIQKYMHEAVPLNTWLSGYTDWGGSDYFKYPYSGNKYGANDLDPDPSVGPYTYVPALYNHLWIGHYVYIAPGFGGVNSDWEFNQYGALIAGEASSGWPATPAGFGGAVVPMPTNPPPPPPPVQVFSKKPLPKPHPKPVPKPTPLPTPLPTPRLRPSPTPEQTAESVAAPVAVESPAPPPCASLTCALNALPPGWMLLLGAALVLGALLVSGVLLLPRRAGVAVAGVPSTQEAGSPLLPPAFDDATAPASAIVEAPEDAPADVAADAPAPTQGEGGVSDDEPASVADVADAAEPAPLLGPRIVSVLEPGSTPSQPASDEMEE